MGKHLPKERCFSYNEHVIEEMFMAGVKPKVISETLNIPSKALRVRLSKSGMTAAKELRDRDLAQEIAAKHGRAT